MKFTGRQYLYPHERRMLIMVLITGLSLFLFKHYVISKINPENLQYANIQPSKDSTIQVKYSLEVEDLPSSINGLKENVPTPKITQIGKNSLTHSKHPKHALNLESNQKINLNTISEAEMIRIGIPKKIARNVDRYRAAGGQFNKKADLLKIYGMDSLLYFKLETHLYHEQSESINSKEESHTNKQLSIDINTASAEELMTIKGIGPSFSKRIIKYREILGFYSNIEQLREVYGIQEENYYQIKDQLYCSPGSGKIDINTLGAYELSRHPYIDYKTAKIIQAYRDQHGQFDSIQDMNQIVILNDSILARIGPYLDFTLK